jgi:type IV fimbrial biogenesis protein FimT
VLAAPRPQRGFSLIELMIGIAIVGLLLMVAIPEFSTFLQNAQIRNGADRVLQGLNLARAEAIRRNASVRFQFVTNLTSSCALSSASLTWVVSLDDPTTGTNKCAETPSESTTPRIVQKQSAAEGAANVVVATTGGSSVTFTGLGRVSGSGITQVDLSNSKGTCVHVDSSGTMRCLRVLLTSGGQAKLCDPKVTDATDPRYCT